SWEALRARRQSLEERGEALKARVAELEAREAERGRVREAAEAQRSGLAQQLEETRRDWGEADRAHGELTNAAHAAEEALSRLREEAAAADSRLQTLLERTSNYAGVSEGARALLAEDDRVA